MEEETDDYISIEEYDRDVRKRFGLGVVVAISAIGVAFFIWIITTFI